MTSERKILAIGGSKSLEMLPYDGRSSTYRVPIPRKVTIDFDELLDQVGEPIQYEEYALQRLSTKTHDKLLWVSTKLGSMRKAEEILKDALLELFVSQPYPYSDPPF